MTADEAIDHVKQKRPDVIFVNGKTCTGKTTFAKRLMTGLGYTMLEMDTIARNDVIKPLNLPVTGETLKELYKYRNRLDWVETFIGALRHRAQQAISSGQQVVFDGAMPNITTMKELFAELPHPEIIFFHPEDLKKYERYVTQRFLQTDESHNSGLPPSFWDRMDDAEFKKFCQTRKLSLSIQKIIESYGVYGLKSSSERLSELRRNFNDVLVVEI